MTTQTAETKLPINVFNTNRGYTDKGQRIAWLALAREFFDDRTSTLVAFYDVDRGVHGLVRVEGIPSDSKVLDQYDRCAYVRAMVMGGIIEGALAHAAASI